MEKDNLSKSTPFQDHFKKEIGELTPIEKEKFYREFPMTPDEAFRKIDKFFPYVEVREGVEYSFSKTDNNISIELRTQLRKKGEDGKWYIVRIMNCAMLHGEKEYHDAIKLDLYKQFLSNIEHAYTMLVINKASINLTDIRGNLIFPLDSNQED